MHDQELEALRAGVDCRAVLEQAGWELDTAESTRHAAKFRNGADIVIVTHEGKGWFDPLDGGRGDVIALAQRVWGGNLGQARKALRPMAGVAPMLTPGHRERSMPKPIEAKKAWAKARQIAPGSQGWTYFTVERNLPVETLQRAIGAGVLREGIYGTVWALHRRADCEVCGWEMRGPSYKGFSKGGDKALFWIGQIETAARVAVTESAIDAMSLATHEGWHQGTAYVSTGGGFGSITANALRELVHRNARIVAATDRGQGGELLADRLHSLAADIGNDFGRLRSIGKDWNEDLTRRA